MNDELDRARRALSTMHRENERKYEEMIAMREEIDQLKHDLAFSQRLADRRHKIMMMPANRKSDARSDHH